MTTSPELPTRLKSHLEMAGIRDGGTDYGRIMHQSYEVLEALRDRLDAAFKADRLSMEPGSLGALIAALNSSTARWNEAAKSKRDGTNLSPAHEDALFVAMVDAADDVMKRAKMVLMQRLASSVQELPWDWDYPLERR